MTFSFSSFFLFWVCAAYFIDGFDIGKFTMKVVDDVRTLNKNVHFRPSSNCYSMNDLASLWEKKIGRKIPRVTISEDDLLAVSAGSIIHHFHRIFFLQSNPITIQHPIIFYHLAMV